MVCLLRVDQPEALTGVIGLPSEESRGLLEDLPLLLRTRTLRRSRRNSSRSAVVSPSAAALVQVSLLDPDPQALLGDAQILGDLGQRLAAGTDQPDRFSAELRRIGRTSSWHMDSPPRPEGP